MNELRVFTSAEFGNVRAMTFEGAPWVVGHEVAAALGWAATTDAVTCHVPEADRRLVRGVIKAPRGVHLINEGGIDSLLSRSKVSKAKTKRLKKWLTGEVLPALREPAKPEPTPPEPSKEVSLPVNPPGASHCADCLPFVVGTVVLAALRSAGFTVSLDGKGNAPGEGQPEALPVPSPTPPPAPAASAAQDEATPPGKEEAPGWDAEKLRKVMKNRKLSLMTLSEKCGLNYTSVSKYTTGFRVPPVEKRAMICRALNLPETYFDKS